MLVGSAVGKTVGELSRAAVQFSSSFVLAYSESVPFDLPARTEVKMRTPFEQNLMLADLIAAEEFFERGPTKVRRLKQRANLDGNWVEPEVLLDFLAVDRLEVASTNGRIPL